MDSIQPTNMPSVTEISTGQYTVMESKERKEPDRYVQQQKAHSSMGDSVELSETARLMLAVQQEITMIDEQEKNGYSEEQKKKIEELKAKIESGEYVVDSKKIAKSILIEEDIVTR